MLGLLCDTIVLAVLVGWLQGDEPDWLRLFLVALGIAAVNLVLGLLLGGTLGIYVLVPVVIADGFILMLFCHLTIKQAGIAVAILLGYQVVFYVVMSKLFAMPESGETAAAWTLPARSAA